MNILGIADNHDAGAALVADGRLVSAVSQERIDREKNSGAFPWGAIDAALEKAGLRYRDVHRVVVGTAFTPSWALRRRPDLHHQRRSKGQFDPALDAYIAWQVGLRKSGLHVHEAEACRRLLARKLLDRGFSAASVEMMDHHEAHAEAAYRSQGRSRALVLTLDAMGDGTSATAWVGREGQMDRYWWQSGFAGINLFYSRITELLGFTAIRHEGKVTGLAARATPPPGLLQHLRGLLRFEGPGFNRIIPRRSRPDDATYGPIRQYSREEVAAAAQAVLEEAVLAFVRHWIKRTGVRDLAVAGGTFANVLLNQRIAALPEVDSLWVYPHMGDGGLPAGAALGSAGSPPAESASLYLGPSFSDNEIAKELSIAGLRPHRPEDLEARVAELLAAGKVVARFDGGMEFGPRALGNRSILARPDDPSINDWLNQRLQRSEFMPFAPVVLEEDADRLFTGLGKVRSAARFMTTCLPATEELRRTAAGVVHVDGTARPQVLRDADNPGYARILRLFKQRTGIPALVNTSFNMHEEPIVCSPHDAIRAWKLGKLDALAIGPYLVEAAGS